MGLLGLAVLAVRKGLFSPNVSNDANVTFQSVNGVIHVMNFRESFFLYLIQVTFGEMIQLIVFSLKLENMAICDLL